MFKFIICGLTNTNTVIYVVVEVDVCNSCEQLFVLVSLKSITCALGSDYTPDLKNCIDMRRCVTYTLICNMCSYICECICNVQAIGLLVWHAIVRRFVCSKRILIQIYAYVLSR